MLRYVRIIIGNILISFAYAFIVIPNGVINGGVTSFSMSLNRLVPVDLLTVNVWVTIVMIAIMALCYVCLEKDYFFGSLFSCVCYIVIFNLLCLMVTDGVREFVCTYWIPCVAGAAVVLGTGYYFCISSRSTTVGMDTIAVILHEKFEKLPVAPTMYAINIIILLLGLYTYGWRSVLIGIAFAGVQAGVLHLLLGKDEKKETE